MALRMFRDICDRINANNAEGGARYVIDALFNDLHDLGTITDAMTRAEHEYENHAALRTDEHRSLIELSLILTYGPEYHEIRPRLAALIFRYFHHP